jgi:probable O-glycosylation ligase (exosortase A-associated)
MKGLLFTYALTYGGAVVSLFNPFYGLLIYVCFAIMRPETMWQWSVPSGGNYSRVVAIALLVGWAINGFGNWNFGRCRSIVLCLIGFISWMGLATTTAAFPADAWVRVEALLKVVLPFLVGMSTIHSLKQLNMLTWTILASEGFVAYRLNVDYYGGVFNLTDNQLRFADLDNNGVAITMVATAGMAFFCGLRESVWWRRALAFGIGAIVTHVVLFSNSRGGMLALVVSAAASFLLIRKQPSHYLYFLLALLIGLRLAGPPVIERFSTIFAAAEDRDSSAEGRLGLSATMLRIMNEYPLTGIGPGNFILLSDRYGWTAGKDGHTTWLQVGAENGVPGMLFLMGFYLLTIKQSWRLIRPKLRAPAELADFGRMTIASLIGFMISAQFVTVYGVELPYYVVLLGASAVKLADLERYGAHDVDTETHFTAMTSAGWNP